jgi:hypothetical protein
MKYLNIAVALCGLTLASGSTQAEDIACFSTTFRLIGPNDKVCVSAFDDPKVPGVTCHISQARTGGLTGTFGLPKIRRGSPSRAARSVPSASTSPNWPAKKRSTPRVHRCFSSIPMCFALSTRHATRSSMLRSAIG